MRSNHAARIRSTEEAIMKLRNIVLISTLAFGLLAGPLIAEAQRIGITADQLHIFDDPSMPSKEFRVMRMTYAPGGQNPKHYHTSHVVFYVLEGAGVWQEDGKEAVTLKPGDTLHVRPGMIHSHRNASSSEKLVFLEFVIVEKGQRSTVPMP